jgi:hypothetical protein
VIVIGDGAELPAAAAAGLDVRFISVADKGAAPPDLAVTGFAIRRRPGNRLSSEAWVEIANRGKEPRKASLSIETEVGAPLAAETVELAPGATASRALPDVAAAAPRLLARVRPASGEDRFSDDDVAYAVAPERRRRRVLLVSDGNFFLEGALLLDPAVALETIPRAALRGRPGPRPDVVILDGAPLGGAPPGVPAFVFGPDAFPEGDDAPALVGRRGVALRPIITDVARGHPVSRWLALTDVNVKRAARLAPRAGDTVLARAIKDPIALAGLRGGRRVVAAGWSAAESDLPLRVGFPVFLVNALDWLVGDDDPLARAAETGRPTSLPAPDGAAVITAPDGATAATTVRGGALTLTPARPGFYRIAAADGSWTFDVAANVPASERDPRATGELRLGDKVAPAPAPADAMPGRPLRTNLLLAALALLVLELLGYHRRVTV